MPSKPLTQAQVLARATRMNFRGELKAYKDAQRSLGERINEDVDWWYQQAKDFMLNSEDDRAKVDLLKTVLGKIAPELKETTRIDHTPPENRNPTPQGTVFIIQGNVQRGTRQAREKAIEIQAQRRLLDLKEAEAIDGDEAANQSAATR